MVDPEVFQDCMRIVCAWRHPTPCWNISPHGGVPVALVHSRSRRTRHVYLTPNPDQECGQQVCIGSKVVLITWDSHQVVLSGVPLDSEVNTLPSLINEETVLQPLGPRVPRQRRFLATGVRGGWDCERGPLVGQASLSLQSQVNHIMKDVRQRTVEIGGYFGVVDIPEFSVRVGALEPANFMARYCESSNFTDDAGELCGCAVVTTAGTLVDTATE